MQPDASPSQIATARPRGNASRPGVTAPMAGAASGPAPDMACSHGVRRRSAPAPPSAHLCAPRPAICAPRFRHSPMADSGRCQAGAPIRSAIRCSWATSARRTSPLPPGAAICVAARFVPAPGPAPHGPPVSGGKNHISGCCATFRSVIGSPRLPAHRDRPDMPGTISLTSWPSASFSRDPKPARTPGFGQPLPPRTRHGHPDPVPQTVASPDMEAPGGRTARPARTTPVLASVIPQCFRSMAPAHCGVSGAGAPRTHPPGSGARRARVAALFDPAAPPAATRRGRSPARGQGERRPARGVSAGSRPLCDCRDGSCADGL